MKLELFKITKTYGTTVALNDFSAEFTPGVYGILGANGAGKSTLINLITDNVKRDAGEKGGRILYDGEEILRLGRRFRRKVGYMPQQQGMYDEFTARAFLRYMAGIKGIPSRQAKKEVEELLEVVNLSEYARKRVGGFSGGMKQRVMLAQALLGDPEILILDEPTAGLDPKERIVIRNYIAGLSKNKIILFATHVVSDIECIADKVLVIKSGNRAAYASPSELIEQIHGKVWEKRCTMEEAERLQRQYKAGCLRQRQDGLYLRLVCDDRPEGFEHTENNLDLEDVYLYYFE